MKKNFLVIALSLVLTPVAFAGGLLTNTNQSVSFLRNPARGASTEIDAVYTNPAGLAFLKKDGMHLSLNVQSAFQERTITSTFAPFVGFGGSETKEFKGEASAPVIPSLQAAYKMDKWVISGSFAVTGGGGKATFNKGLGSFESQVAVLPLLLSSQGVPANQYSVDSYMEGQQYIYGIQLGGTYKINDMFAVYAGARLNIVDNSYAGYLRNIQANPTHPSLNPTGAMMSAPTFFNNAKNAALGAAGMLQSAVNDGIGDQMIGAGEMSQAQVDQLAAGLGMESTALGSLTVNQVQGAYTNAAETYENSANQTADKELNCDQSGWGITPIIGFDFKYKNLNVGVKYEHNTHLNIENKTKINTTGVASYDDGVNTPNDIPGLLTIGAQYSILPSLRVMAGSHLYFDKQADMANNKEKYLDHNTYEFLFGAEWDITKWLLISAGAQTTNYGATNDFQNDMSFSLNSYSVGFGAGFNVLEDLRIDVAYFFTKYDTYNKEVTDYNGMGMPGKDQFNRTNKVFGIGVNYCF